MLLESYCPLQQVKCLHEDERCSSVKLTSYMCAYGSGLRTQHGMARLALDEGPRNQRRGCRQPRCGAAYVLHLQALLRKARFHLLDQK